MRVGRGVGWQVRCGNNVTGTLGEGESHGTVSCPGAAVKAGAHRPSVGMGGEDIIGEEKGSVWLVLLLCGVVGIGRVYVPCVEE